MELKTKIQVALNSCEPNKNRVDKLVIIINDFINELDNETINKIRNSKSDAEVRRLLKSELNK